MFARRLWGFIRLSRPFFLSGGVLLYLLGVCTALYEGSVFDPVSFLVGQVMVTATQMMVQYGNEYFDREVDAAAGNDRTWLTGGSGILASGIFQASFAQRAAWVCGAIALVCLAVVTGLSLAGGLLGIVVIAVSWAYSAPPVRLMDRGLGEISASLIVAFCTPLFGWLLQSRAGSFPLLLLAICIPLVLIHTSMLIAFDYPDLRTDASHGKHTLVVRLGTRTSAWLHDGLIAAAFITYGLWACLSPGAQKPGLAFMANGGWLVFLALPLAGWQIGRIHWQLRHPQAGYQLFVTGALALFALMVMLWLAGLFSGMS